MSTDLSDADRGRTAGHAPASGSPITCPPGGWTRSTPATTATRRRAAGGARLREVVHPSSARPGSRRRRGRRSTAPACRCRPGQARPVNEVLNQYQVPRPCNIIGIGMGGPTVIAWGTEEHEAAVPARHRDQRGDLVPAVQRAGRGLRRRGARDPRGARRRRVGRERPEGVDDARAPRHATGCCSRRTDPDQPKHRGLSYFVVDMHAARRRGAAAACRSPATPSSTRCSSTNARVPDAWRLGPDGDGWRVAITTLMNERVSLSGAGSVGGDTVGGSPVQRRASNATGR